MSSFENCTKISHPIIEHKLAKIRDKATNSGDFRRIVGELTRLLAYEVTRDLELEDKQVETPIDTADVKVVAEDLVAVSIMRAGNGMLESFITMVPFAKAGHIGLYRDKFLKTTVEYFFRLPEHAESKRIILLDPLLATGHTAQAAITRLKEYGVKKMQFVCLLASPEGINAMREVHPDVHIYCASIDKKLNDSGYIVPGLGDAGDRLYDTVVK